MDAHFPIPPDLKLEIEREANARGISPQDFVRQSVESAISHRRTDDPLFSDTAVHRDNGPADLALNHDNYLYGDAS